MERRIDTERVKRETVEYYDKRPVIGDALDSEPIGTFPDPGPEAARWQADLKEIVRGRGALELACGTGTGTRVAAEAATSILAIDSGESCVRLARERTSLPHVEFLVADAFDLAALPGDFEAAFACGFFHLIPKARYGEFLAGFHAKLRPGAPVFLQATHSRTIRAKKRLFRVADCDSTIRLTRRACVRSSRPACAISTSTSVTPGGGSPTATDPPTLTSPRVRPLFVGAARVLRVERVVLGVASLSNEPGAQEGAKISHAVASAGGKGAKVSSLQSDPTRSDHAIVGVCVPSSVGSHAFCSSVRSSSVLAQQEASEGPETRC